jgi:putative heme-binding domain-containing protein
VPALLHDPDALVRRAAALAAGALDVRQAARALVDLARDGDPATRSACLASLVRLREPGAVAAAIAALDDPVSQVAAIGYLAEFGDADQAAALLSIASSSRSIDVLGPVVRALSHWQSRQPADSPAARELGRAIAGIQGACGVCLQWQVLGPVAGASAEARRTEIASPRTAVAGSRAALAAAPESRIELPAPASAAAGSVWLAAADVEVKETTRAQFLAGGAGPIAIWLNGENVFRRRQDRPFEPDADRFESQLVGGANRIVVETGAASPAVFHVRFRAVGTSAEHERLAQSALARSGDAGRGRELFRNREKSLCLNCHRIGQEGNTIGPDLAGIGARFSRIHLIESILEPSRTVLPAYRSETVTLASGRSLTGVKIAEDAVTLTLGDETGKRHEIRKSDIEDRAPQARSIMPEGLEKRLSEREFLDLVTFLASEKGTGGTGR